ncbi:MAG TPA: hypothetical protein VFR34_06525 [Paracoccaceae bacterium]|nr:hypothetical protein [Paracoccaceae bacterium]
MAGLLFPEDVGAADAARVLAFVNEVASADAMADTVGFAEGPGIGRLVAEAILARREAAGPFATLAELDAVTGVNARRFTEIVVALSGARPPREAPAAGAAAPRGALFFRAIRIRPARSELWLGQSVGITLQLVDSSGRGLPGAPVTCIASWGILAGRHGAERQRGPSVALVTGPGGIASLTLSPPLTPPLDPHGRAALEAELARLPDTAATPAAAAAALAALAARYRADGSEALRGAVERLLAAVPAEPAPSHSPWPILPVTLIAVAGAEGAGGAIDSADAVAVANLRLRVWLGGWLAALRDVIAASDRIVPTLGHLPLDILTGGEIARGVLGAGRAIAGLERGAAGRMLRDVAANAALNRFVAENVGRVAAAALTDVVRAAGASNAAIAGGGFAVFDAIETVQEVQGSIAGRREVGDLSVLDGRLGVLEGRLELVEETALDRTALDGLRADILGEAAALDARTESRVNAGFESRLAGFEERFAADVRRQVDALRDEMRETGGREVLGALELRVREISAELGRLAESQVTREELAALEARLGERVSADVGVAVGGLRGELGARIDAKADAAAVTGLQRSVSGLAAESQRIGQRLDGLDVQVRDLGTRIGPIR